MGILKKITALLFALFVLGVVNHANAQLPAAVSLVSGSTVTFDGLQFTVSSCSFRSNGTTSTCSAANDLLQVVASNRGTPTIEILGNGSGTDGGTGSIAKGSAALACNACTGTSLLTVTIGVKRASGKASTITAFSNAITGNITNSGITSKVYYATNTLKSSENAATKLSSGTIAITNALTSTSSTMSFKVTLGLSAYSSGVLALNSDRLNFSPAPEPATIALFGVGLVGLTTVRRRLKRNAATTSDQASPAPIGR